MVELIGWIFIIVGIVGFFRNNEVYRMRIAFIDLFFGNDECWLLYKNKYGKNLDNVIRSYGFMVLQFWKHDMADFIIADDIRKILYENNESEFDLDED